MLAGEATPFWHIHQEHVIRSPHPRHPVRHRHYRAGGSGNTAPTRKAPLDPDDQRLPRTCGDEPSNPVASIAVQATCPALAGTHPPANDGTQTASPASYQEPAFI